MGSNCWEAMECGREPGGRLAAEKGVCPAATFRPADGFLGGQNGGRACCFIAGTLCDDSVQGTHRDKTKQCWDCPFYAELRREHGAAFSLPAFACHIRREDRSAFRRLVRENDTA
jgi:hypothetical protein